MLNVDTGKWVLLDPMQLCGIERREWTADWRFVNAVRRGSEPQWWKLRGSRYRVHFNITSSQHKRVRAALTEFSRAALSGWGCQAVNRRDCSYEDDVQRTCAAGIRVEVTPSAARILLGNTGDCRGAAELLRIRLHETLASPLLKSRGQYGGAAGHEHATHSYATARSGLVMPKHKAAIRFLGANAATMRITNETREVPDSRLPAPLAQCPNVLEDAKVCLRLPV